MKQDESYMKNKSTRRVVLALALSLSFINVAIAAPGDADSSFDTDGNVSVVFSSGASRAFNVDIQTDGKIVTVGYANNGSDDDFALTRHNPDGSLDNTFSTDGVVTTPISANEDHGYDIVIQPDGKILVAGHTNNGATRDIALVRYNTDGSLDTSFDTDGIVITSISGSDDYARAITLQPDGKIVMGGTSNSVFVVARYNVDGSLDTSFDTDGIVTTGVGPGADFLSDMALLPDGKIQIAGNNNAGFTSVRYNSDGSLDTTFDTDGITSPSITGQLAAIAIQPDGKTLAAGYSYQVEVGNFSWDFVVVRYNSDGTLDTSFDTDGIFAYDTGGSDFFYDINVQPDGKILVASRSGFSLVRLNSDGSFDNSFGTNGITTTPGGGLTFASAIQPDGTALLAGGTGNFAIGRILLNDANDDGVAEPWDLTADAFSFTDQNNIELSSVQTSENITVSGLGAGLSVPVTVSGGEYAIDSGAYTTNMAYVSNGQQISVRHTGGSEIGSSVNTLLKLGGLHQTNNINVLLGGITEDTFTSTTSHDVTPDAFSFIDKTDVAVSTIITSNSINVTGITTTVEISVSNGEYAINGGAFTSTNGSVSNNDTVIVRHTSMDSNEASVVTTLNIGGVSETFTSTTALAANSSGGSMSYWSMLLMLCLPLLRRRKK